MPLPLSTFMGREGREIPTTMGGGTHLLLSLLTGYQDGLTHHLFHITPTKVAHSHERSALCTAHFFFFFFFFLKMLSLGSPTTG